MDNDPHLPRSPFPEPSPGRRETARKRVRTLKVGAAVAASGVFAAAAAAAHEAHPGGGSASSGTGSLTVPTAFAQRLTESDDFGNGGSISPAPSSGTDLPRTETHTS
jgi:hypothetical protein